MPTTTPASPQATVPRTVPHGDGAHLDGALATIGDALGDIVRIPGVYWCGYHPTPAPRGVS